MYLIIIHTYKKFGAWKHNILLKHSCCYPSFFKSQYKINIPDKNE